MGDIPLSEIITLTVIGLMIGGGFLVYLLIGDAREAKRKAKETNQRQVRQEASIEREGVWPPPPKHEDT